MISRAKEAVVKFNPFTNVPDTSLLVVRLHGGIGSTTERILVVFKNQIAHDMEVMDTEINVWLNANAAMQIYGQWFKEITVPECNKTTEAEASAAAVGTEIIYWSWGGPDTVTVSEEDLLNGAIQVVVPIRQAETIDIRIAWRIGIRGGWYLYIDMLSGEVIRIDQLFQI